MAIRWGGWTKLSQRSARGVQLPVYDLFLRKVLYWRWVSGAQRTGVVFYGLHFTAEATLAQRCRSALPTSRGKWVHSRDASPALLPVVEPPPLLCPEKWVVSTQKGFNGLPWGKEAKLVNIEVSRCLGFLGKHSQQFTLKNFHLCFIWRPDRLGSKDWFYSTGLQTLYT